MFVNENYFALQSVLNQRLADELSDIFQPTQIHSGFDLAKVRDGTIVYPAVFVVYMQDADIVSTSSNTHELVTQRWQIILAYRDVTSPRVSGPLMEGAGHILYRIIRAIKGYQPFEDWSPLKRVLGEKASYPEPGLAFFPIEFTTKTSLE